MNDYQRLQALSTHTSLMLGVAFECAMDNAGFDGYHLHTLDAEQTAEVLRHARSILDSRSLDFSDAEHAEGMRILF